MGISAIWGWRVFLPPALRTAVSFGVVACHGNHSYKMVYMLSDPNPWQVMMPRFSAVQKCMRAWMARFQLFCVSSRVDLVTKLAADVHGTPTLVFAQRLAVHKQILDSTCFFLHFFAIIGHNIAGFQFSAKKRKKAYFYHRYLVASVLHSAATFSVPHFQLCLEDQCLRPTCLEGLDVSLAIGNLQRTLPCIASHASSNVNACAALMLSRI